jgi:hypothetical protein
MARRQQGLVTTLQARAALTEGQLRHRRKAGRLETVRPGVLRVAGSPETWEQQVMAAVLAGGDGALASFRAAASLWALEGFDRRPPLEITVPSTRRARLPGVIVHDTMILGSRHRDRHGGIPVTSLPRTLCDLTAVCSRSTVARALDDAVRRDLTSAQRVDRVFRDLAHRGRRRSRTMRAILEERLAGFDPGGSEQELKILRWIVGAGLPRPVQQHPVHVDGVTYRLDLAYPDLRIGIEYDGWDPHRMRGSFDRDRIRQNPFEIRDWMMLRYTSASTREQVVGEVAQARARRSSTT